MATSTVEFRSRTPGRIRAQTLVASALLLLAWASGAYAFMLRFQGLGDPALDSAAAQVLYGSDADGRPVAITSIGARGPGGTTVIDIGYPAMLPDGRVLLGAELRTPDGPAHWELLVADVQAPAERRLTRLLDGASYAAGCTPVLRSDPAPRTGRTGEIAFMASQAFGGDILFLYSQGKVSCLVHAGQSTAEGDTIANLAFGTQDLGAPGEAVFEAWVKAGDNHRQALLLESGGTVRELAREDGPGPNHVRYGALGTPTALATDSGTAVAFTARTEAGASLFFYHDGQMTRVLSVGNSTAVGPISYLSPGRPALTPNGVMAVLASCGRLPSILRLHSSRLNLDIHRGQVTPFGTELESFGDPALSDSGTLYVGAADSEGQEKIYVLSSDGAFSALGSDELLYKIAYHGDHSTAAVGPSLVVNGRGDFSYLGGK